MYVRMINSKDTSLNHVPALLKVEGIGGIIDRNLDIGAGKYTKATDYLWKNRVKNICYDPFNLSVEDNLKALQQAASPGIGSITIANVLNVIWSKAEIWDLLKLAKTFSKGNYNAPVYISIYEGDRKGEGRTTKKGWQRNEKKKAYVYMLNEMFLSVESKPYGFICMDR